jgi:hypothetical protein
MSRGTDGDISQMVNTNPDELETSGIGDGKESGEKMSNRPYDGEDICKPYNLTARKMGAVNEWRDKKYQWDELVENLNSKVFGNKEFKET